MVMRILTVKSTFCPKSSADESHEASKSPLLPEWFIITGAYIIVTTVALIYPYSSISH